MIRHSLDAGLVELSSPDSTSSRSELGAVAFLRLVGDGAASTLRAVRAALSAAAGGVNGHLVGLHQVDSLDDIDLATSGPVGSFGPETGPHLYISYVRLTREH